MNHIYKKVFTRHLFSYNIHNVVKIQHMYIKEHYMTTTSKRMRSNNVEKFAKLNPKLTEIKTFVSNDSGMVDLYVNQAMDVAISMDKKDIYRLNKDRSDIRSLIPNNHLCMDMRIKGVFTKCSRNVLITHLFGKEAVDRKSTVRTECYNKKSYNIEEFDPANTIVEKSFGFNLVKNKDINVYFDMDNHTFYNGSGIIKSPRGLKTSIYTIFKKDGDIVRKSMLEDHIIAMMYGYEITKGSIVTIVDESLPLTKENIKVMNKNSYLSQTLSGKPKNYSLSKEKKEQQRRLVRSYVTEDYAKFDNQDAALDHQIKVEKAKEIAKMIIDSGKVGWDLAEQAYLKVMDIDRSNVQYKNFIDVVNNNNGIMEVKKESMKIDLNVNIDTLIIDSENTEAAQVLVCEIKDRINKLKAL